MCFQEAFFRDGDEEAAAGDGAAGTEEASLESTTATLPLPTVPLAPHFADDSMHQPGVDRPPIRKMRTCQVYFGSRTHKQIAQVVRELKRTAYADARTAVLGSREYYCIHPRVSKLPEKNEKCKELRSNREGQSCRYYHNAGRVKNHHHLHALTGISGAHDIEELVQGGHRSHCCPYYLARQLASDSAEIVFCPYNYLVDPLIRDAMEISLRGHVVVLDEAHNIEDCSREAASCQLLIDDLCDAMTDVEVVGEKANKLTASRALALFLSILSGWMAKNSRELEDSFDSAKNSQIFVGSKMLEILDELEIGRKQWVLIKECLTELTEEPEDVVDPPKLKSGTLMLLRSVFLIYHFLFTRPAADADDYRVIVSKVQAKRKQPSPEENNTWIRRKRRNNNTFHTSWTVSLNFICLNPGVAFSEVGKLTRNIILTSGTLSPMTSFQSELGVPFSVQLEANHVIDGKQVWVGTVGKGPNNLPLQATYRNTESPHFQDELGCLLISVCQVVPRGVLCFLPSYSLLDKLVSRWQESGVWAGLCSKKEVLVEPRRSEEFQKTINLFYDTIRNAGASSSRGEDRDGALLLAVCRGKVSEGLDFTDDNARAVVAVGIPFPNFKDAQVTLKREYNDRHHRSRGLLSGSAWYEIQAYRALNQALGRCLRHRYDWGALLLVDGRFQQPERSGSRQEHNRYIRSLSKWVRSMVVHHASFRDALHDMTLFTQRMIKCPPCDATAPMKNAVGNSSPSVKHERKGPIVVSSAARAAGPEEPQTSAKISLSEHLSFGGPITSTQIDDLNSNGNPTPPELSQITLSNSPTLNRFLEETADPDFGEYPSPTFGSRIRRSNMDKAAEKISRRSFSLPNLSNNPSNSGALLPDVSTPSSKLANLFSAKLQTASPVILDGEDRKRKRESPNRKSSAKKECISSIQPTSQPETLCSSRLKFKFTCAEKVESLSPIVSTPSNYNEQETCYAVTPVKLTFGADQSPAPPSPDLFNSSGEQQLESSPRVSQLHTNSPSGRSPVQLLDKQKHVPLPQRPVIPPPTLTVSDDSDLEDFDMNKSTRRSPELKRRVKEPAPRRKGVVFSKFNDK